MIVNYQSHGFPNKVVDLITTNQVDSNLSVPGNDESISNRSSSHGESHPLDAPEKHKEITSDRTTDRYPKSSNTDITYENPTPKSDRSYQRSQIVRQGTRGITI